MIHKADGEASGGNGAKASLEVPDGLGKGYAWSEAGMLDGFFSMR